MSMPCPKCGRKSAITDSRFSPRTTTTRRRYRCLSRCAWKWSTSEIIVLQGNSKHGANSVEFRMEKTKVMLNRALADRPIPVRLTCKSLNLSMAGEIRLKP